MIGPNMLLVALGGLLVLELSGRVLRLGRG
jgi:hypothetical protein